ncbi:MAG: cysteine desulfurase [Clostridia bacterium]|nr:cysteine desulfurase [Clostridia bacterium]
MIYLDYTAHTPPSPAALQAFLEAEGSLCGNANAHHAAGQMAKEYMDRAQKRLSELLCPAAPDPDGIIFTSGASESNNTAIQGIAYAARHVGRHIITNPLEHPSVSGCLTALQERGYEIDVLPITKQGLIDLDALRACLRSDTVLLTLPRVDSELGVIQPLEEVREILKAYPACRLHVDVTQAAGKMPLDLSLTDTAALSAHKFGGITGSGILYKKRDVDMEPLIHGGVSTSLYRSGTPAVGLAVSMQVALEDAVSNLSENDEKVASLNRFLRLQMEKRRVRIFSPEGALPHILSLGVDGIKGAAMRDQLNLHGVCVSVKSACSVENTPSRAVFAVTKSRKQAMEAFRVSLSHQTSEEDLRAFLEIFDLTCKELQK